MAKIKKPVLKKLPKKPKPSASLSDWEKYKDKVEDIQKENGDKWSAYEKAVKANEKAKKDRDAIRKSMASPKKIKPKKGRK